MKFKKYVVIISIPGLLIYACGKKYLEKDALGGLYETNIANKRGVEKLLIGAYSMLDGIGGNKSWWYSAASNWFYGSICGSEAYKGSEPGDDPITTPIEIFKVAATNDAIASKWGTVYDGVQRSNDVLRIMAKATDIEPADQKRIAGEARFLRAFYHFEAKKMWNKIPYVDETITYGNGNYHVANDTSWSPLENDLKFAIDNLGPDPYQGSPGRATKYTAMALLAKAYLFQKKFNDAKPLLEEIISSTKFRLVDHYGDNFDPAKKNGVESIFSAQMSVNDGATQETGYGYNNGNFGDVLNFPHTGVPGECCGFFQPSQYFVNHFKTDPSTGLPDLITYNENPVTSDQGVPSSAPFTPYTGSLDPRLDWTVGRRGIPYLDWGNHPGAAWIRDTANGGPYSPKKNVFSKINEAEQTDQAYWTWGTTANNVNLIRYADVLLWAAEVEAELDHLDKAQEYVNKIRNRAADPSGWVHTYVDPLDPSKGFTNIPAAHYVIQPYPDGEFGAKGKEYALKAIRYERMLELGMEGHRFFDLVRWGIAEEEINAYLLKEKTMRTHLHDANFVKGCDEYFPIPQVQLDLSAGADGIRKMSQNPCY